MSNLPKGDHLNTIGDLQNVIAGIILRQYQEFSEQDILIQVENWCEGSCYASNGKKNQEVDVKNIIHSTLNILYMEGCVKFDRNQNTYSLSMSFPAI